MQAPSTLALALALALALTLTLTLTLTLALTRTLTLVLPRLLDGYSSLYREVLRLYVGTSGGTLRQVMPPLDRPCTSAISALHLLHLPYISPLAVARCARGG